MRIALLSLHFAEYACRLAAALATEHEVLLLLSDRNAKDELEQELEYFRQLPRLTISIIRHRKSPLQMLANLRRILAEVKAFQPDVLHLQEDTKDYLVAAVALLHRRYPFVMTVHDPSPHSGADARQMHYSRHVLYRDLQRTMPDHVITHGEQLCRDMERLVPRLTGRVSACSIGPYGPLVPSEQPYQPGNLLFFGRINEYKGLRYFLEAVLLLRQRGLAVKGVIAGTGADLAPNRATIDAHDCFELHDEFIARDKLNQLFQQAQLLIMPYVDATQSGVAAMAQGFGRLVVATEVGSIPELVLHEKTGLIVPPRDPVALADAIESLLRDPARARAMEAQVRDYAQRRWGEVVASTNAVYARAIARHQQR